MLYEFLSDISCYSEKTVCEIRKQIKPYFPESNDLKRKESVCAKGMLCHVLNVLFSLRDFSFETKENGKPYLVDSDIHFNISHSGDFVLLLIGDEEVGCDIQITKEYNDKIAKRFFTEKEYEALAESNNKALDFTKIWTLKESILKYYGSGITGGLSKYDFSCYYGFENFKAYGLCFRTRNNGEYVWSVCSNSDEIIIEHSDINQV